MDRLRRGLVLLGILAAVAGCATVSSPPSEVGGPRADLRPAISGLRPLVPHYRLVGTPTLRGYAQSVQFSAGTATVRQGAGGASPWLINIGQLAGAAPSATNPFPTRLSTGTGFYDARDRNWTITESLTIGTLPAITGSVTANQGTANATPWNDNLAQVGGVVVAATAKGTQGTNFVPIQRPQDGGRTHVVLYVDAIAGITTEALATLTQNKGGTVTTGTSYTVTAGKTLRLIGGGVQIGNTSTTVCNVRVRLRADTTVSVTSPIYIPAGAIVASGTVAAGANMALALPDGVEFAGGTQIAISHFSNSTSCLVSFMVVGFEY